MVHQHFQLVPVMTVAENIDARQRDDQERPARPQGRAGDGPRAVRPSTGWRVDPDAEIEDLPVGTQQRVEILKALSRKADLLILDEPTAVLTPQETDELLDVMKELAAGGTSIVFITHKLREVLAVADRVYALRRARSSARSRRRDRRGRAGHDDGGTQRRAARGEGAAPTRGRRAGGPGSRRPRRSKLTRGRQRRSASPSGPARSSGVAGVEGNGQRELVEAIAGMRPPESGVA